MLQPENMFVVSANGNVHIKMADFDLSLAIQPDESGGNASNTGKLNLFYTYSSKKNNALM